jgi:hypothetical protein
LKLISKNKTNDLPFVSYSSTCKKVNKNIGYYPIEHRMKVYKKFYGFDTFIVKNYTNEEVDSTCIKRVNEAGLKIQEVVNVIS